MGYLLNRKFDLQQFKSQINRVLTTKPVYLSKMEKISVPRPKIGEVIEVNHENRGSVSMKVVDVRGNLLECDFEGIEVCVRLGKVFNGESWFPRWESITN